MRASNLAALAAFSIAGSAFADPAPSPLRADPASPALVAAPVISDNPEHGSVLAAAGMIAGGDLGMLSMPALSVPGPRQASFGIGYDYFRGSKFLLPGATIQRSGLTAGLAYAPLPWLELYGALAYNWANRFGPDTPHQTLSSLGDSDLGAKFVIPTRSAFTAGAIFELDLPGGGLKATGGRVAGLASIGQNVGPVPLVGTVLLGYVIDNTYKLNSQPGTFAAYALNESLYDRGQLEFSVQSPLRYASPSLELAIEAPVARGQSLPVNDPARVRLLLGATAIHTGVPGLTASVGIAFSLRRTGQTYADAQPTPGFAPDSLWRALLSVSYAFAIPERKAQIWHDDPGLMTTGSPSAKPRNAPLLGQAVGTGAQKMKAPPPMPIIAAPPIPAGTGRISVFVIDAHTQLPLQSAWVSAIELGDLGTTTGADGRAMLDAPPGQVTLAVAHDGFDPFSDIAEVVEGKDRELTISLLPQLTDATIRGRIIALDESPRRASIELRPANPQPGAPQPLLGEPPLFDGSFQLAVPHGAFNLIAAAPGYASEPLPVDMLPGETTVRDIILRRVPNAPLVKLTQTRVEVSERVSFTKGSAQITPTGQALLDEVFKVLAKAGPVIIGVRIEPSEMTQGEDELSALLLAEQRAQAVVDALVQRGSFRSQLVAHGLGIAREGQLLFEIKRAVGSENK